MSDEDTVAQDAATSQEAGDGEAIPMQNIAPTDGGDAPADGPATEGSGVEGPTGDVAVDVGDVAADDGGGGEQGDAVAPLPVDTQKSFSSAQAAAVTTRDASAAQLLDTSGEDADQWIKIRSKFKLFVGKQSVRAPHRSTVAHALHTQSCVCIQLMYGRRMSRVSDLYSCVPVLV